MAITADNGNSVMRYNGKVCNTIENGLQVTIARYNQRNIQPIINTSIREWFLKHAKVCQDFSACLIHRHFGIAENERNLETNGLEEFEGFYASGWMFHYGN